MRLLGVGGRFRHALANDLRLAPLVLFLVQLLEVEEGVLVLWIETDHLRERLERSVNKAAPSEVQPETQQDVGVFQASEPWSLEQALMNLDRFADLPLFAIQVAEDQVDLERILVEPGRLRELFDGQVELVRDKEVQSQDVVWGLTGFPPVDPVAVAELVALPGFAGGKTHE